MRRTVTLPSGEDTLEAFLYLPDQGKGPWPAIVLAGGWCYVKELVQPSFAEAFVHRGFAALIFDYRTMGGSTGEPRQNINPWDQIEDYKNAISYVQSLAEVDGERIGVWGISYSGAHVVALAAHDPRVKAMASVVPVIDGYQSMRLTHGTVGLRRLKEALLADRKARFETGVYGYLAHNPAAEGDLATWPFPTSRAMFDELIAREGAPYVGRATTASTEWLFEYTVLPYAGRIIDTPSLFVLAENDDHTHVDIALDAYRAIPCPKKSVVMLSKTSHQSIYRSYRDRNYAADPCGQWFAKHLKSPNGV